MSLAHKYVNLKDPYNQDINEQITTNFFLKRKQAFQFEIPTPETQCVEGVFQIQSPPLFVVLTFQTIYQQPWRHYALSS